MHLIVWVYPTKHYKTGTFPVTLNTKENKMLCKYIIILLWHIFKFSVKVYLHHDISAFHNIQKLKISTAEGSMLENRTI